MRDVRVRVCTKGYLCLFRGDGLKIGHGGTRVGLGMRSKKEGAVEANLRMREPEAWTRELVRCTRHRV